MTYVMVVLITIFSASGIEQPQKLTLQFSNKTDCVEARNLIKVGLSFYDLASKNSNYSAYVGRCTHDEKRKQIKKL